MDTNKTVLLTGAFGQVGHRCLELLTGREYRVVALDIANEKNELIERKLRTALPAGRSFVTENLNLLDERAVAEAVVRHAPDVIIHLAAIVSPVCYSNPVLARKINVGGTAALVKAAQALSTPPLFVFASSSAVYGSCNPVTHPEGITLARPVKPIECYGEDKVAGENLLIASGLPYAILRLAGVMSPDAMANMTEDYQILVRATPGDNRVHGIDARDAALAFANAVSLGNEHQNSVFLIGGNDSYLKTQCDIGDDVMAVMGIGRLGDKVSLPGDPNDELGWSFTDWYDTREAEAVLQFQKHNWSETLEWIAASISPGTRFAMKIFGPAIRLMMRAKHSRQLRRDKRGDYADPWKYLAQHYGEKVISPCDL